MAETELDPKSEPLRAICRAWQRRIRRAEEFKRKEFGVWAEEGMRFYVGDTDVWDRCMLDGRGRTVEQDEDAPQPKFKFVLAKVAELVQIYGPTLYHRNPVRTVTLRKLPELERALYVDARIQQEMQRIQQQAQQQAPPPQPGMPPQQPPMDPQSQMMLQQLQMTLQQQEQQFQQLQTERQQIQTRAKARSDLIRQYLNYTPNETDLKSHCRRAINEALIKGMGCLWTGMRKLPDGRFQVESAYDTVDNFVIDPDAEAWEDIKWVAQRCVGWIYDVAADYGFEIDELRQKANFESVTSQGETSDKSRTDKDRDMVVYWKVWSNIGIGDRLPGVPEEYVDTIRGFGQNVYLVLGGDKFSEPFNLSAKDVRLTKKSKRKQADPERAQKLSEKADEAFAKVQWPIPFYLDKQWPVSPLYYHEIPNSVWPMAHIRTSLPFLKFLNWQMSFLADKSRQTAREIVGIKKGMDDEVKEQIRSGEPLTIVELSSSQNEKLSELMQVFTHPQGGSTELMTVASQVQAQFDKSSGLTELAYAMPGGMRSAKEAEIKSAARNIRPDEMAQKTEDWMSLVARKEALAAIWLLDGADVEPVLAAEGARLWDELIASQDPLEVARELEFRIEAGSAKKPNKESEIANMNMAIQSMGGVLMKLVDRGINAPFNAMMMDWAKANDIQDFERYLIPPPPPPQPPQADPNVAAKAQAELQKIQAESQARMQETQLRQQELQMQLAGKQQDIAIDAAAGQQKLQFEQAKFAIQMQQLQQKQQMAAMQPQVPQQGAM